jgi:hypothetical protein
MKSGQNVSRNYKHSLSCACLGNLSYDHRYRKAKIDCLRFVMRPLLAQLEIGFFSSFSAAAVYSTNEANKAGLKQSIIFRCLWLRHNSQKNGFYFSSQTLRDQGKYGHVAAVGVFTQSTLSGFRTLHALNHRCQYFYRCLWLPLMSTFWG